MNILRFTKNPIFDSNLRNLRYLKAAPEHSLVKYFYYLSTEADKGRSQFQIAMSMGNHFRTILSNLKKTIANLNKNYWIHKYFSFFTNPKLV